MLLQCVLAQADSSKLLAQHPPLMAINGCRRLPRAVMSTQDERDMVATCLSMGATDYLVKPLRHNELRNIWTRIWWWQRVGGSGLEQGLWQGSQLTADS